MKDFSKTLIPCGHIGTIIKMGKTFNNKKLQKLEELQMKPILTMDEAEKYYKLLEEQEACDILSKTAKSWLTKRYVVEKYYRDAEATPLQMVKGSRVEVDSLGFFCEVTGASHRKNNKKYENDYLVGTPDVVEKDFVIEIKSSWDIFTFLNNVKSDVNAQYYWQLQGYMAVTKKKTAELVYCLVSTPDELIEEEYVRLITRNPSILRNKKKNEALRESLFFNMRFDDIPKEERILRFSVERNDFDIERIYKKVKQCREYLQEFQDKHLFFTKHHRKSVLSSQKTEVEDGNADD